MYCKEGPWILFKGNISTFNNIFIKYDLINEYYMWDKTYYDGEAFYDISRISTNNRSIYSVREVKPL